MYQQYIMLVLLLSAVNSELFTSVSHLYRSVLAGRDLAIALRNFSHVHEQGTKLEKLKTISDQMEQHCSIALKDPNRYIANPIGAFLYIKRFTLDWERDVQPILHESIMSQTELTELQEIREHLPSYEDLEGVAAAVFRLQDTYKLNTTRLADGFIYEQYIQRLSAEDCYQLGRLAFKMNKYKYVHIWMETSLEKVRTEQIHGYEIHGRELAGQIEHVSNLTNEQLMLDRGLERAPNRRKKYSRTEKRKENATVKEKTTFDALCRGEDVIKVQKRHRFKCRYHYNIKSPLLILNPAKKEILHFSPKIVLYHDFISDAEIEDITTVSLPLLKTSEIDNFGKHVKSEKRNSKNTFLGRGCIEADLRIQKRIEAITGLSMKASERLQVANYGIDGYFTAHADYFHKADSCRGNRIATWLNYLNDVEGGATVFLHLGVRIQPKAGAAIFWYNLYRNGSSSKITIHGACPVLIGSKWVATYWILEKGQEFKRPWSTNPKE